jgi:Rps23 Pro-64 3,4-dihydroxylase Tpa1-like proline 4-hydroxylase
MGARPVRPKGFDFQLAMTGDGGFFHGHVDGSDDVLSDRRLAFVLFCHVEPRAFTGGQLNIYDRLSVDRWLHDAERVTVQPEQNRMVFFPPRFVHEVTTVALASRRFDDGRFTANGWVRW